MDDGKTLSALHEPDGLIEANEKALSQQQALDHSQHEKHSQEIKRRDDPAAAKSSDRQQGHEQTGCNQQIMGLDDENGNVRQLPPWEHVVTKLRELWDGVCRSKREIGRADYQ